MLDRSDYREVARYYLKAMEIRERSYVPGEMVVGRSGVCLHSSGYYALDYREAAERAVPGDKHGAALLHMLMVGCWNDAEAWAREILGE